MKFLHRISIVHLATFQQTNNYHLNEFNSESYWPTLTNFTFQVFQVTVPSSHKGLTLKADTSGKEKIQTTVFCTNWIEYGWMYERGWTISEWVDGLIHMWLNGQFSWKDEVLEIAGSWENPGSGYKTLGSGCITHSNRSNKGRKSFVFRSVKMLVMMVT